MKFSSILRTTGLLGVFAVVLAIGCGQTKSREAKNPQPKTQTANAAVVIGYLQTRDHRITIKADGLYTIADKDGNVLAENVTLKELQASNPRLHEVLQRAVARKDNPLIAPNNDASISPKPDPVSGFAKR